MASSETAANHLPLSKEGMDVGRLESSTFVPYHPLSFKPSKDIVFLGIIHYTFFYQENRNGRQLPERTSGCEGGSGGGDGIGVGVRVGVDRGDNLGLTASMIYAGRISPQMGDRGDG
ncbi:hypothetical protein BPOR_0652g00020 [Botrytis porri]|uniref:Uncharacterized protein n=1 Tax=Botrytis porri TaxID=87229 RepID=A0A4Z1KB72_9HELO|nr:hypothetical protein BPOR_0652g00020 [Botrytis porri]